MMVPTSEIDATSGPDGFGGLRFRRSIYALLIAISAGMMIARIAQVESSDPKSQTPFLSADDRSRWATIRSLGDDGTYVIDDVIFKQKRKSRSRLAQSIWSGIVDRIAADLLLE